MALILRLLQYTTRFFTNVLVSCNVGPAVLITNKSKKKKNQKKTPERMCFNDVITMKRNQFRDMLPHPYRVLTSTNKKSEQEGYGGVRRT